MNKYHTGKSIYDKEEKHRRTKCTKVLKIYKKEKSDIIKKKGHIIYPMEIYKSGYNV